MERPPGAELQKQTVWLFGVLVGLAIKEAIVGVYKDVATSSEFWGGSLEVLRLFLFLLVIVRFYLGAVQYFYAVHASPHADAAFPHKSFSLDFFFGFGHFIMFCVLGLSATAGGKHWWLFPSILAIVLSYDVFWYFASRGLSTKPAIRLWMVINAVTVVVGALVFMVCAFGHMWLSNGHQMTLTQHQKAACEFAAYVPVFLASIIDLGSALGGPSAIERWLSESVHRPKALGG